jgi:TnpA family transposase
MVRADVPALRRERLSWVSQNFIRDDTLRVAGAVLVAAHDVLPIAQVWGSGEVASADGVRFVVRGGPVHAGFNPRYFGHRRGITQVTIWSPTNRPAWAASPCRAPFATAWCCSACSWSRRRRCGRRRS